MKLLITEKDPLVRQLLNAQAAELGLQLIFADGSQQTLAAISAELPDCVVLDASSSSDAPAPLWRELRDNPATNHLPLVLYSSCQRWQRVAELASPQVDSYLPRPFSTQGLLEAAQQATWRRAHAQA